MKIQSLLFLLLTTLFSSSLYSHGFSMSMPVKRADKVWSIGQLYKNPQKQKLWVSSFNLQSQSISNQDITRVGKSQANCYICIAFDDNYHNDILCTPTQELFVVNQQQFVAACQLQIGDVLFSAYLGSVTIKSIELIEQPIMVYALEVARDHNFFVGNYGILAHNMFFPVLISLSSSLGSGAAIGGATGGCFMILIKINSIHTVNMKRLHIIIPIAREERALALKMAKRH
jgi:hypothetical protein